MCVLSMSAAASSSSWLPLKAFPDQIPSQSLSLPEYTVHCLSFNSSSSWGSPPPPSRLQLKEFLFGCEPLSTLFCPFQGNWFSIASGPDSPALLIHNIKPQSHNSINCYFACKPLSPATSRAGAKSECGLFRLSEAPEPSFRLHNKL